MPSEDRQPGVHGPPRVYVLMGCSCPHEDWEHSAERRGCLIRGCKCTGWWTSRLEEAA